jgi:hypothetical protein
VQIAAALWRLHAKAEHLAKRGTILIWPGGPHRRIYPWNPLATNPVRQVADDSCRLSCSSA